MALFGGNDQELRVTIRAKDEATKDLNKVQTSLGKLAGGFALGTAAVEGLRAGFRFLSGVVTDSIREFEEQQLAVAQLNAVLRSTNNAAGLTSKELIAMADSLAKTTLYADDMVLSAQNMLLTFTNITKDIFPDTIAAVLDMSTALGQDLKSSAIQLGKALNNPIEGVSALQRVGVSFNNAQQEMIETMVKSGRTMEAQRFILAELQKEFGGSAKGAYEAASSVTKLQKNITELKEGIGSGLVPAMNNLFGAFSDVTTGMGRTVDTGKVVFKTFANISTGAVALGNLITQVGAGFAATSVQIAKWATLSPIFDRTTANAYDDQLAAIGNVANKSGEFLDSLVKRNRDVLRSWGEVTTEARIFGDVGPEAYQATAAEAKKATDRIKETKRAIADTKKTLDDYRMDLMGETDNIAQIFVAQEQKIKDIQKQLKDEESKEVGNRDPKRIAELQGELQKEYSAYSGARGIENQLPSQIAEARRRAAGTDFERNLEDAGRRVVSKQSDFAQSIVYQINFNDAVAGDEGIKRIIADTLAVINRQAALGAAGR